MGSEWFRTYAPVGARSGGADRRPRLVCFPHAGGAASAYVRFSRLLAQSCEVLSVQYPGRQDRRHEEPVADVARLADTLADEVARHVEGPYALFGHSMGAVLAYETARRLDARRTSTPTRLFLSGRGAPTTEPAPHDRLVTDAQLLAAVARLGGTAPDLLDDPELRAMVLPALRADYRALGSYVWTPGPKLRVPVTVLIGDSDPVVTVAEAAAWERFTAAPTECRVFGGGHFYLDDHLPAVVRTVTAALAEQTTAPESGRRTVYASVPHGRPGTPARAAGGTAVALADEPAGPGGARE